MTSWPTPDKIYKQANYKHLPWGHGGKSWAAWGCPALSLIPLVRLAGIRAGETPETAQARLLSASPAIWAPDSSKAVLPWLARRLGFSCPETTAAWDVRTGMTVRAMERAILSAIDGMGLAPRHGFGWLHVDYDGDEIGNHWLGAFASDATHFHCVDSVPGEVVKLDRKTLTGEAQWGKTTRHYRVVRGYPLTVAG